MSNDFVRLAVVSIVVAIDNALLTGLLLPTLRQKNRVQVVGLVGVAMAIAQVILAMGVGSLLEVGLFRILAIGVLIWMSIKRIHDMQMYTRGVSHAIIRISLSLFIYSALGNLDNMIWLGTYLKGHILWLAFFSTMTIPLFMMVALFLSDQCQKYGWISILGAGMMAWAAATLCLTMPPTERFAVQMPSLLFHLLFTIVVLTAGFAIRKARVRI